ncbi:twin arginine-targeting protein translocase TatC [Paenibacillus selenitireducens]|uniref:Sec-independent protein translocase protein TatC n=1 Tax=Paenibacillus selenitireducens TaxID=1324314 RepID=A0A1T2X2F3_9BACL|nr:twin-arginine translocase subunit TatC [Paenibacillus selenitireducens]OPA74078.1 twin arginine-targeting protein translocase TatC [Paenibacillus selenitireducens]
MTGQQVDDMTVWEHIGELRKRIFYILIVLVLGMILGFIVTDPIYNYLITIAPVKDMSFHAFSMWDAIGIYMKFAFVIGLIVGLPFTFYQVWLFVRPGLREIERKGTVQYIPFVLLLFLAGVAFSYYVVFPLAFNFTTDMSKHMGLVETYGVTQYFSFLFNIIIPISLLFELPIVIMFLTKIRIVNPKRLRKMRRVAYFALIFIGVVITPPDLISDSLVAIPLILLYEFSVWMSSIVYRKQLAREQAWEEEFEQEDLQNQDA